MPVHPDPESAPPMERTKPMFTGGMVLVFGVTVAVVIIIVITVLRSVPGQ